MSNKPESPISITVKSGAGSLITVRADDGAELDTIVASSLASIESAVKELEGIAGSKATANAAGFVKAQFPGATEVVEQPPFNPTPSLGGGRSCKHGKMTAIQGPAKTGGIYKGYFCPSPQGATDKCRTVYVNKSDADWNSFVPYKIK